MTLLRTLLALLLGLACTLAQAQAPDRDALVLVAHHGVPRIDTATAQRLYSGRAIEVGGVAITVVNLAPGHRLRERFLAAVMEQDNDRYVAYWTVRKHIGKGTPPRELKTTAEVLEFVLASPGGMGYLAAGDLRPGMNVVLRP
ncbi:MAG: hypothetical protein Q8K45_05015 [Rubrivivax sp.]|nr:hypothetical protein [Rubrivivax sp.]